MKVPDVSFKLGNFDTIKLQKKTKDCSLLIFIWMFVITKSKVEGYEVTIIRSVCDIYKNQ